MRTEAALKFCLDPVAARSLCNEVDLLRRVQAEGRHPGIVQLRNTYLSADPPFVEYEYIAGGDLVSILAQWHDLAPRQRVEWTAQLIHHLAGIIGFAHCLRPKAIIHRDLKPANVLVQATSAGKFSIKVADFGIGGVMAEHAISGMTRRNSRGVFLTEVLRGTYTPIYASPEQQRGLDPDPRDDVFSLGMIWLHLLTGDLMLQPIGNWGRAITHLPMPDAMTDLLNRCLEGRAEWRLENAAVLEEELGVLLGVKKQSATVPTPQPPPGSQVKVPQPPPVPQDEDDPAAALIATLQGHETAHERARSAVKRYDFAEAARILDGIPADHRNHNEYAHACRARDRRAFLDPAIKQATQQQNLFKLRFLLAEALWWMPKRPTWFGFATWFIRGPRSSSIPSACGSSSFRRERS